MTIFETSRLTVRRYTEADADDFFRFSGNEEVMRYIRPVISREESDKFLVENIKLYHDFPGMGRWAAYDKQSGIFIGSFSLLVLDAAKNTTHIGYALLPEHWGRGYASELLKTGILHFFNTNGTDELFAITNPLNTPSQKVLLKAGFKYVGVMEREDAPLLYSFNRQQLADDK